MSCIGLLAPTRPIPILIWSLSTYFVAHLLIFCANLSVCVCDRSDDCGCSVRSVVAVSGSAAPRLAGSVTSGHTTRSKCTPVCRYVICIVAPYFVVLLGNAVPDVHCDEISKWSEDEYCVPAEPPVRSCEVKDKVEPD